MGREVSFFYISVWEVIQVCIRGENGVHVTFNFKNDSASPDLVTANSY